jgi:HD-like signal output (HDOD) protein
VHALECAIACRCIAAERSRDKFTAYLLGLTHDVGKIAIFRILVQAFRDVNQDVVLRSSVFKPFMIERSAVLSFLIAKDWTFPESLLVALEEQANQTAPGTMTPLGQLLFLGNLCSEIHMLEQAEIYEQEQGAALLQRYGLSHHLIEKVHAELNANDM